MQTYKSGRVAFIPTDVEALARAAAPWARVLREGRLGYWCAESEEALREAHR